VLAGTTFDTSKYPQTQNGNVSVVFWVVVWMQDQNGKLVGELPGHGLSAIPPTAVPSNPSGITDPCSLSLFCTVAKVEETSDAQGTTYSNNVGFFPQAFYVAGATLGATPGPVSAAALDISKVDLSATQITTRDNIVVSATLLASGGPASGVSANFYDGDPKSNGRLINVQRIPHVNAFDPYPVQALYRTSTCGVHEIFVAINKGKRNEVVRRAPPLRVVCNP
jgi:hypothetical protein